MNTDLLREFAVFAEYLNYTVAARVLHVSQPTLSRHIAELEADLGAMLVVCAPNASLTYAGETLLAETGRLLQVEAELRECIAEASRKRMASLRLEHYPYMRSVSVSVSRALNDMQESNPDLYLDVDFLQPRKRETVYESVLNGYFDIAFLARTSITTPEFPVPEGLTAIPLTNHSSRLCFLVGASHPFAQHSVLSIADLDGQEVLLAVNHQFENIREDLRTVFTTFGVKVVEIPFRVNDMSEFAFSDLGSRIHFLTEDDLTSPTSPYYMNSRCKIVHCSDEVVTTPYLICREVEGNPVVSMFLSALNNASMRPQGAARPVDATDLEAPKSPLTPENGR